jgi:hypothetical protein
LHGTQVQLGCANIFKPIIGWENWSLTIVHVCLLISLS